jgi:predicted enzyme related to lactoylglutathione lyase
MVPPGPIDEVNRAVQATGGRIMMPKQEIGPNMGWISLFMDSENNTIGLHEAPPTGGRAIET